MASDRKGSAKRRMIDRPGRRTNSTRQQREPRGGGKRNGLLLAAAPLVGGFLAKKLRNRQSV